MAAAQPSRMSELTFGALATLERILGCDITEDPEDFKRRMLALSKKELVEKLLRAKGPNSQAGTSNASNGSAAWGNGKQTKNGGAAWNSEGQAENGVAAWDSGEQAKNGGGAAWDSGEQAKGGDASDWNNDNGGNAWEGGGEGDGDNASDGGW